MVIHLLVTSTSLASQCVISTLLARPNCPAIRLVISQDDSNRTSPTTLHPGLQADPHSIIRITGYEGPALEDIFKGIDVVFHDGPDLNPEDGAKSIAIINAAKAAGVSHFIFCSVFQPFRTGLPMHVINMNLEGYLLESRLSCTILQPVSAMQDLPLKHAITSGKLEASFSTSLQHGYVDFNEVALVACTIIFDPKRHNRATYELVGQNASYDEIAGFISHATGSSIKCETIAPAAFVAQMKAAGKLKTAIGEDFLMRTLLYYDRHASPGNPNTLHWLLGRAPKTWADYLRHALRL